MTKNTKIILGIIVAVVIIGGIWLGVGREADAPVAEEEKVIKIGAILPLTGEAATYGQAAQRGIDLAVEKVEKENNIKLEIIYEDSQMDPKKAVDAAQKLINLDGVKYLVGFGSSNDLAVCPISESNKVVLLSPAASSPELTTKCGDYTFSNFPSDIYQGKILADKVYNKGFKKIAIMYINNDYGVGLKNEFEKNFNGTILISEAHNSSDVDFKTQLTKIKSTNPEAIVLISQLTEGSRILKQRIELEINQPVFASEGLKDNNLLENPANVLKDVYPIFISQYEGKEYQEYKNAYLQKYGEEFGAFSDYVYDSVLTLANAVKECDSANDTECVKLNLYKTNIKGATGLIKFDKNGDIVDKPYSLYKIENNEFVLEK